MRMDNSWSRDLAMSASTEIGAGMTHALFHGCDEQDVKILSDWFRKTTHSAGHPMLLPALFAELQLRRHKRQGQKNWNKLVKLYSITGQYKNHVPGSSSASFREDQIDYDNTTREILGMHQDTSFLEKSHMKFPRTLKQMLAQLAVFGINAPQARTDFIATESARIGLRLDEMINDYEGLIENCKLVTDGASLLTGAVSLSYCSHNPHLMFTYESSYRYGISLHKTRTLLISRLPPIRVNSLLQPDETVLR